MKNKMITRAFWSLTAILALPLAAADFNELQEQAAKTEEQFVDILNNARMPQAKREELGKRWNDLSGQIVGILKNAEKELKPLHDKIAQDAAKLEQQGPVFDTDAKSFEKDIENYNARCNDKTPPSQAEFCNNETARLQERQAQLQQQQDQINAAIEEYNKKIEALDAVASKYTAQLESWLKQAAFLLEEAKAAAEPDSP